MVDEIVIGLEDVAACTPWPMAFPIAKNTLQSLLKAFRKHDMAIFVFSPDDDVVMREQAYKVVRDNVLFEAGMFMGMQGDDRAFIVSPRDVDFHTATDLLGITTAAYEPDQVKRDITSEVFDLKPTRRQDPYRRLA